jgi:prolipoprotein diacylglyceryltransferase
MPEMFRIFSVPVSGYMFFYILGIVIGAIPILWLSRKEELDTVEVAAFILLGIVCGWLGSRLLGSAFHQIARLGKQPFSFQALREDFQTGGSFFGAVTASLLFAPLMGHHGYRHRSWTRHRPPGLLCLRLLFRHPHQPALGSIIHLARQCAPSFRRHPPASGPAL